MESMNLKQVGDLVMESGLTLDEARRQFDSAVIKASLEHNKNNQCRASKALGVHRNTLARTMRLLGIQLNGRKPPKIAPYSVRRRPSEPDILITVGR